jgi:hypothetical protein
MKANEKIDWSKCDPEAVPHIQRTIYGLAMMLESVGKEDYPKAEQWQRYAVDAHTDAMLSMSILQD